MTRKIKIQWTTECVRDTGDIISDIHSEKVDFTIEGNDNREETVKKMVALLAHKIEKEILSNV